MKYLIPCLLFVLCACQPDVRDSNAGSMQPPAPVTGNSLYKSGSDSLIESGEVIFPDGEYEATIDYYNPNTGKKSNYKLTVEVQDNQVVKICFPNGGWLDTDHFSGASLNKNGHTSFVSDKGYQYKIIIGH